MKKGYKPKEQPDNDRKRTIEELHSQLQLVKKELYQRDQQSRRLKQQIKRIETLFFLYLGPH